MNQPEFPEDDVLPAFATIILVIIVALFAVRNLPWHLDDDEQAKQAFVSYQMIENGKWLVQETPTGRVATKPPLQGWISAGAYLGMGARGWELAWRLPAFVAALLILRALWKTGDAIFGNNIGSMLAVCAFGLNSYVPRLATLVRTDMLLTAFIFFTGLLILEKLRTGKPWTWRHSALTFLLLLGSTLTKGPIAYGFLLPGMIVFGILMLVKHLRGERSSGDGHAWGRHLPKAVLLSLAWLLPLAIFGAWIYWAVQRSGGIDGEFYQQVVEKEFKGRFTTGEKAVHHNFWPGSYTAWLLLRTLPWTLLLAAMFFVKGVWAACWKKPEVLWLLCWTFGGLIFMECVPSKRFDRILPVVPPACLLLAALAGSLPGFRLFKEPIGRLAILLPLLAVPIAAGYAGWKVVKNFRNDARALVVFGEKVRDTVQGRRLKLAVVNGKDEGMLMYAGAQQFTDMDDALQLWKHQRIDWLVLGENDFTEHRAALEPFEVVASTPPLPDKFSSYRLLRHPDQATRTLSPTPIAPAPGTAGESSFIPPIPEKPNPTPSPSLQEPKK